MKTFDSFLDSSNDKLADLLENVVREHFPDYERLSYEQLTSKIITVSRSVTLDTLRVYHEWLSEQIQE